MFCLENNNLKAVFDRLPFPDYIVYKKKNEKGFFAGAVSIQFDNVEIEVLDKDILEIGYLIENKKIRLDFKLV